MFSALKTNVTLYKDMLRLRIYSSHNRCRFEHILYPPGKINWSDNDEKPYDFPCNKCFLKIGRFCTVARFDLKVK